MSVSSNVICLIITGRVKEKGSFLVATDFFVSKHLN